MLASKLLLAITLVGTAQAAQHLQKVEQPKLDKLGQPTWPTVIGTGTSSRAYRCGGQAGAWHKSNNLPMPTFRSGSVPQPIEAKEFGTSGLSIKVDTSFCNFKYASPTQTPRYVTSIVGDAAHWQLVGVNSIYKPTATGFQLFLWHPTLRGSYLTYYAKRYNWKLNWAAQTDKRSGITRKGRSGWKQHKRHTNMVYVDVDTRGSGFKSTPSYVVSLHGKYNHWRAQGAHTIYRPTKTGFRVYVTYPLTKDSNISPASAEVFRWQIAYIGSTDKSQGGKWKQAKKAVYLDVKIPKVESPIFLTSFNAGMTARSATPVWGGAAIYRYTSTGFRVYLKGASAAFANKAGWRISYMTVFTKRNCILGEWSKYGKCSKTCGKGIQFSTRKIKVKAMFSGMCPKRRLQQRFCNTANCPVDCKVGAWTKFSKCSKTCGKGIRWRKRKMVSNRRFGGKKCPQFVERMGCNGGNCPVHCKLSAFSKWSTCSKKCGMGKQTRTRTVLRIPKHQGFKCPQLTHTKPCIVIKCPVPCKGYYSVFSRCSKTCGTGTKSKSFRTVQVPKNRGKACPASTVRVQCYAGKCPKNCKFTAFGAWSKCTKSCGVGGQHRKRTILNFKKGKGHVCPHLREDRKCGIRLCPSDCTVTAWSNFGKCTKTCGSKGVRFSTRKVASPSSRGGKRCPKTVRTKRCNSHKCPIDCVQTKFGKWWSKTVKKCGKLQQFRQRTVKTPSRYGGRSCKHAKQTRVVDLGHCPHHCIMDRWHDWTHCTKSCSGGTQSRKRKIKEHAKHGGYKCGITYMTRTCNTLKCPIDCGHGSWSTWTTCTKSCRQIKRGEQTRFRKILRKAMYGGKKCASTKGWRHCNDHKCPTNCVISPWARWGKCTKSCGWGIRHATRKILKNAMFGGKKCGGLARTKKCMVIMCPVHCRVGAWGKWTTCTKSCFNGFRKGQKYSKRKILTHHKYGGNGCPATSRSSRCNMHWCPVDCKCTTWSKWSSCTKSCRHWALAAHQIGTQFKKRRCSRPVFGGKKCGDIHKHQKCARNICPVCQYTKWNAWSACTKTCGPNAGMRVSTRRIKRLHGNAWCKAPLKRTRPCAKLPKCPVHCKMSAWGKWGKCARSCGPCARMRYRTIIQHAKHKGIKCPPLFQQQACNNYQSVTTTQTILSKRKGYHTASTTFKNLGAGARCTVSVSARQTDYDWKRHEWLQITSHGRVSKRLNVNCGYTKQCSHALAACKLSSRIVDANSAGSLTVSATQGRHTNYCPYSGFYMWAKVTVSCKPRVPLYCPVDCKMGPWGPWASNLIEQNGSGGKINLKRVRYLIRGAKYGGKQCPPRTQYKLFKCAPRTVYGPWSQCSKKCGSGHKYRHREQTICSGIAAVHYQTRFTEGRLCNLKRCKNRKNEVTIYKVKIPAVNRKDQLKNKRQAQEKAWTLTATAHFGPDNKNSGALKGSIVFSQKNGAKYATVKVSLKGFAGGYKWFISSKHNKHLKSCAGSITGSPYRKLERTCGLLSAPNSDVLVQRTCLDTNDIIMKGKLHYRNQRVSHVGEGIANRALVIVDHNGKPLACARITGDHHLKSVGLTAT